MRPMVEVPIAEQIAAVDWAARGARLACENRRATPPERELAERRAVALEAALETLKAIASVRRRRRNRNG